jgi:hypothetical protein
MFITFFLSMALFVSAHALVLMLKIELLSVSIVIFLRLLKFDPTLFVKNAFLHGELHEEVYMHPTLGYSIPDGHICLLRHSLYGLKQVPRAWFEHFTSVVTAVGFAATQHDPTLFVHTSPHRRTFILLYVDDILIIGDGSEYIVFVMGCLSE